MSECTLDALLHEFEDRFPETLPEGLPPHRNVDHAVVLEPGHISLSASI